MGSAAADPPGTFPVHAKTDETSDLTWCIPVQSPKSPLTAYSHDASTTLCSAPAQQSIQQDSPAVAELGSVSTLMRLDHRSCSLSLLCPLVVVRDGSGGNGHGRTEEEPDVASMTGGSYRVLGHVLDNMSSCNVSASSSSIQATIEDVNKLRSVLCIEGAPPFTSHLDIPSLLQNVASTLGTTLSCVQHEESSFLHPGDRGWWIHRNSMGRWNGLISLKLATSEVVKSA